MNAGILNRIKAISERGALAKKESANSYVETIYVKNELLKKKDFPYKMEKLEKLEKPEKMEKIEEAKELEELEDRPCLLYIPLVDPKPQKKYNILRHHIRSKSFFDLAKILEKGAEKKSIYKNALESSYKQTMPLYEKLSQVVQTAQGKGSKARRKAYYRKAFYLCEVLAAHEPTLASLDFLGDFISWNLNYTVRALNWNQIHFSASDETTAYFIKRCNQKWKEEGRPYDEDFALLTALFRKQAFLKRSKKKLLL